MLPEKLLLPQIVAHRADDSPEQVFLRDVSGETRTYGELHERALCWARAFDRVCPEEATPVLTMLPTSPTTVDVWLGLAWSRGLYVPLNNDYRGWMLESAVASAGARILLTTAEALPRFLERPAIVEQLKTVVVVTGDGATVDKPASLRVVDAQEFLNAGRSHALSRPVPRSSDYAAIIFTSGTTGVSKGVTVYWAQLHASASCYIPWEDMGPRDVFYAPFPMFHLSGLYPLYIMALANGSVVLRERFKTDAFWEDVATYGCTTTLLLGAMVEFLASQPEQPTDGDTPLQKVAMVPLHHRVEEFKRRFGLRVTTSFGSTEVGHPIMSDGWNLVDACSCGRLRDGYQVRLVDDNDDEVLDGEIGELAVRADKPWTTMAGYWNMPAETVHATRNQWVHSGDLLRRDADGNYYFVDRKTDSIRRRGENISSLEVEIEVSAHPEIDEAAVIAAPSEFGEDEVMVVAVRVPGSGLAERALIDFLTPRMPRFMVPRYVEFVGTLPKTPTQKVRKLELRKRGLTERTWDRDATRQEPGQ